MRWRAGLVAVALLLAGCARPAPPVDARPALWRVSDAATTIWLIGTIHALPPQVRWETPTVRAAIAAADTLVLEVPPAAGDAHAQFEAMARAPGLPPLSARVAPADRALLARGIAAAGQSAGDLQGYRTWGAALVLGSAGGHVNDASGDLGVEPVLAERFRGKAIGALETRAGQLRLFDRLPEASQRTLLRDAAQDAVDPARGYRMLLSAWMAGDARALAATLESVRRDPVLTNSLIVARNRRWAGAIVRRMARPGRVLVAVGAGHLVGAGSVVDLLRARGVKVDRLQ
ncbi:TraB/GumN family protein [Sphingomonas sp. TREG-RG-20F-R18-01]|uniref:TraB/GumN family protein n=1 Tax=Sphingomonas sp. TREG-RG-20F-R18-01 TaxID=2914982 RepID=UPI001F5605B3|nr:TraB/GumN family protein [Sphingomonas sp. TREG-RG-20F-R18-01]